MVILSHSSELIYGDRSHEPLTVAGANLSLGELAVVGFFVLSGFLITGSWQRSRQALTYMAKRVLRIYPAFIVASLFSIFVAGQFGSEDNASYLNSINSALVIYCIALLKSPIPPPTFVSLPYPFVNGSMWTIHYEFLCYLVAPFLVINRYVLGLSLIFTAIAVILAPQPISQFTFAFLVGAAFKIWGFPINRRLIAASTALFGLSLFSIWEIGVPIFGGYLLLVFGLGKSVVQWPDFSYGLYLYGWPIQMMLIWSGLHDAALVFIFSLVLASMLGILSWYVIEKPSLSFFRHKPPKKDQPAGSLLSPQ